MFCNDVCAITTEDHTVDKVAGRWTHFSLRRPSTFFVAHNTMRAVCVVDASSLDFSDLLDFRDSDPCRTLYLATKGKTLKEIKKGDMLRGDNNREGRQ